MTHASSGSKPDDFVYIDLDDPAPWWASLVGIVAVALIVAILIAPWALDWEEQTQETVANIPPQNTSSLCRPNTTGVPEIFVPPLAGWSRFCEWVTETRPYATDIP